MAPKFLQKRAAGRMEEPHAKKLKPKNEKNTHADSDDVNEKLWMFQTDPSAEGKPWFFVPDEVAPKLNALLDPNCPDEGLEIWLPTNMFRNTHFNFDVLQQQKQKKWVLMANENQTRTSRRTAVLQVADQKLRQGGFKLMATFRWQDRAESSPSTPESGPPSTPPAQPPLVRSPAPNDSWHYCVRGPAHVLDATSEISDPTRLSGRLIMKFQIRGESTLMEVIADNAVVRRVPFTGPETTAFDCP